MSVLNPDHLLEQANRLVEPIGGGAPRQADLRRAISAAYYAVFHTVVTEAADEFVGRTHRDSPRYALTFRSVEHRSLRRICDYLVKKLPDKYTTYEPPGGFGPDLVALATAVIDLQEKRHLADYDPLFRTSVLDATLAIETGRAAVERFRNSNRAKRKAFISLLVFTPR